MEHDLEAKTATLSILNVDEKQQHEMWGTFPPSSSQQLQTAAGDMGC